MDAIADGAVFGAAQVTNTCQRRFYATTMRHHRRGDDVILPPTKKNRTKLTRNKPNLTIIA